MASLGVLVAGVAHEINNPVNFISSSIAGFKSNIKFLSELIELYAQLTNGNFEEIKQKIKEKETEIDLLSLFAMFEEAIHIIEIGVERTTKIVKGLRTFARSNENKIELYNIEDNIENTLVILHAQYKDRITIKRKYNQIPPIECYSGQINQVMMNLLINAIQAIENKGTIEINTFKSVNNYVCLSVKDNGTAIAPEMQPKIFDPFFTTKEVGKGTGLGLYIVYNIVNEHGGKIEFDSKLGEGTKFTVFLPQKLSKI